jgi:hypothetical protein
MATRRRLVMLPRPHMALVAAMLIAGATIAHAADAPSIEVTGTVLQARLADGTIRRGADLVGAVLVAVTGNRTVRLRIAAVEPDASDPRGEILLYDFRVLTPQGEAPLCEPDPDGRRLGMPLEGRSDASGMLAAAAAGQFELVCTGGAQGKCARFGYAPWRTAPGGRPMRDWYNACVRMLRADYCGDGRPHTRDGTVVDVYDRIGVQAPAADQALRFEAAWGPDGALCVARTRVPDIVDLDGLARACPRLAGRLGSAVCTDGEAGGLVFNRSR